MNDKLTDWVIKVSNWEYNPDKPKKRWNDFDYIADLLLRHYGVSSGLIEAYIDLIVFAYIDKDENKDVLKLDVYKIKKFIDSNGGVEKLINSFSK